MPVYQAALLGMAVVMALFVPQRTDSIVIRGYRQPLSLYGSRSGDPIIVSSGDGGWIHLAPHVAEGLADKGFFVVGFNAKSYLETFTSGKTTLTVEDEPGDYRVLARYVSGISGKKPILIGVSEGAGLSVLAATDPETKKVISGVIGLGLPDMNELAWRWKDAAIYITHGVPQEPLFSSAAFAAKVAPLPLAAIHSTHDEFVPLEEINAVFGAAREPKKLWIVRASDHGFSDNFAEFDRRLLEAIDWIRQNQPR